MKILVVVLCFFASCFAKSDTVGNGSGLAQKNIILAYSNLTRYIGACLQSRSCKVNKQQRALLKDIVADLPHEKPLEFKSGKSNPSFFLIEGETKVAKTGYQVGDIIFVNSDMIYASDFDGEQQVFSVADGVGLLVHELSHHHGITDEVQADLLGSQVQNLVAGNMQRVESRFLWSPIVAYAYNLPLKQGLTQVWISDGEKLIDLSALIDKARACPTNARKIGSHISNIHWGVTFRVTPTISTFRMGGYLVNFCDVKDPLKFAKLDGRPVAIDSDFQWDGKVFRYIQGSSRLANIGEQPSMLTERVAD